MILQLLFCSITLTNLHSANIGLLITATGKYTMFVPQLIESVEKHFCRNHNVTFYVYTDGEIPEKENTVCIEQKRLVWPYDTMMRFELYLESKDLLQNEDYLFACDADMLFIDRDRR